MRKSAFNLITDAQVERIIVQTICGMAIAHDWTVTIHDDYTGCGEDVVFHSRDIEAIMKAIQSTDGDQIRLHGVDGRLRGIIALVYGNDGFEVVNDYSMRLECFMAGIESACDQLQAMIDV